jgi:hypothetical protein
MIPPITSSTGCVVYRAANAPPASPDVVIANCRLAPRGADSPVMAADYTHILTVPAACDVRDDFTPGSATFGANADKVLIPDQSSPVTFRVVLVRRVGRGTALDHKECLLIRSAVTWPTDEV